MNPKVVTVILLALMSTALLFTSISSLQVQGQSPFGLYIFQVTPQGSLTPIQNGTVGEAVTLTGTLYTANGTFQVFFGDKLVDNGTSQGYLVSSNFTIPETIGGDYNLTLIDVEIGQNYAYDFPILTAYSAKPIVPASPAQLQEGSNVILNVTVTGGQPDTSYGAEIVVVQPDPLSTNFTKTVSLTTSALGTAQIQINYPDSSFSPTGSSSNYAGTYTIYFNASQSLDKEPFTIGFTDLTQYHRQDTVTINAIGYQPIQTASLAIQFNNLTIFSQTVTASSQGTIAATWPVPTNAAIGTYTVSITPQSSPKLLADSQTFAVPGYPVIFTVKNLAGEAVPDILLEALDQATNNLYNATTNLDGQARVNLETGAATINAYYLNAVKVGTTDVSITGNSSYTINCQLTDLKVKVQDKSGVVIPFVNLNLNFQYTTRTGSSETGTLTGQTDVSGVYTFNSTLPGISYNIQASKYNIVFNAGNDTLSSLPAQSTSQATIICPDETLTLKVTDYNNNAISNARVTLIEQASGIFYSLTTDASGFAQKQVTFGQYRVSIYTQDNLLLNQTTINVLNNTSSQIRVFQYNLNLVVKVVDYFGNPIGNINVRLNLPGMTPQSAVTKNDGTATFSNIIGGNVEVVAYPSGNTNAFVATNLNVNSPTSVTLTMSKYVVLAGSLVPTSLLAAIILIVLVVLIVVVMEIFRRTGFRFSRKTES